MDPDLIRELAASRIRVVFYDVGAAGRLMSNIRVNYRRGIERVMEYLHNSGHSRLAFVDHHATLGPLGERESAFIGTVSRYAPGTEWRTVASQDSFEGGQQAAHEILSSGFQPTGIICVNDVMAVGVLREVRDQGLRVPADISVTGFDNIRLSEFSYPPLTTVHIPRDRIGHLAFEMLVPESARGKVGREIVIDPELVLRESTGPAPRRNGR
jgi:DNA-binding LacI/PurR family transcriptional regulator